MVQLKNLRNEVMESLKCTTKPKVSVYSTNLISILKKKKM